MPEMMPVSKKRAAVTNMAKKEQSPLSKLNLALVGIDALLATMDDRNNKQLIIMAQKRIEEATEALITIQTTLGNL